MKNSLLLLLSLFLFTELSAQTANIAPSRYNTIWNNGNLANGAGSYIFSGTNQSGTIRRALLHFDLSSIPAGSTITSATLSMDMNRTQNTVPQNIQLFALSTDWGSGTSDASGNEGPGTTATLNDATWTCGFSNGAGGCNSSWTTPGGDFIASPLASQSVSSLGVYNWSAAALTTAVQSWYNTPASNLGLIVINNEASLRTAKRFNASTVSLIVNYTGPAVTSVDTDPNNAAVCETSNASFSITSTNATAFQWQEFTSTWNNLVDAGVYSGSNTNTLNLTSPSIALSGNQYRCIAIGTNNNDTSTAATLTINTIPSVSLTPNDTSICMGDTVIMTGSANSSHQWYLNGAMISGATSSSYAATMAGVYNMMATDGNGCSDSASTGIMLLVGTIPVVTITPSDTTICSGDSILLMGSNGGSSQWYMNGAMIAGATSNSYMTSMAGHYNMTKTNMSGCSDSASAGTMLIVGTIPNVNISPGDTLICSGDSVLLTGSNGGSSQWYMDGNMIAGATNNTYMATMSGHYNMTKTNMSGCSDSASVGTVITITICSGLDPIALNDHHLMVFPNPANTTLEIRLEDGLLDQLALYNVQGQMVYNKQNIQGENIRLNVQELATGVYFLRAISNGQVMSKKLMIQH